MLLPDWGDVPSYLPGLPFRSGSAFRPLPRGGAAPHTPTPCPPSPAPRLREALRGAPGSARRPQCRLGLERAIGARPGRHPRPPLAHRSGDTAGERGSQPDYTLLSLSTPASAPSAGALQRGGGALPPPPQAPERRLRAALLPGRAAPAALRTYPGRAQGRRERGGGERRGGRAARR